ncbi:MAG: MBL fold metallo-hydrolase [Campylobacterales bacterium]|nr:MBL fold metallo-hydrolase [Campylobacterales bacterium]
MVTVNSYGATQEVTGSCHLLEIDGIKILVDCGMFQGEEESFNERPFTFNPADIDYLFITHAHLDHVGRIPKLVREGFRGKVYTTQATMDLAYIVLLDSVKIMNEDFATKYKKAARRDEISTLQKPLYEPLDVQNTFTILEWVNPEYDKFYDLCEGISFSFKNAGHILGAAFIEFFYMDEGKSHSVIFSGDIGNSNGLVLLKLANAKRAETLFIESTYGDREHRPIEETLSEFKETILSTLQAGGVVMIPSFAIERTQEILCILKDMYNNSLLPHTKIFLDSPMASKATDVYTNHLHHLNYKCQESYKEDGNVFDFEALVYTLSAEESKAINEIESNAIIIAGSGMCNGGRITHHFKHRIWNDKNSVIFVGYQAVGTIGREIVDGAEWINLYGEDIIVKAKVHTINGFSAHADRSGMLTWMKKIEGLEKVFIIHGEKEAQKSFKESIESELSLPAEIVEYAKEIVL